MRCGILALCIACLPCGRALAQSDASLGEVRTTLQQWVETRQLISRSQSDWQSEREMLEQTLALYERELQSIDEQTTKVSTNNTQVVLEMAEAESSKKEAQAAIESAALFAMGFEARLKEMIPMLPEPLRDAVKPLLARMPEDPQSTKMLAAERMQVIVGVLNEFDKFNSSVAIYNEKRQNASGQEMSVETIYVGLGAAYFVNAANDFAGTGSAGANGWEWIEQPSLAPTLRHLIRIYRSESAPAFVSLPASIR